MPVNVYAGQIQPIRLALTSGREKTPVDAFELLRARLQLFDRNTNALLATVDSSVDNDVFYWTRTTATVKGIPGIYLLEMELQDSDLPIQENMIARLTLYDNENPAGISWKQFALNSR